jgi:hypothetical protein
VVKRGSEQGRNAHIRAENHPTGRWDGLPYQLSPIQRSSSLLSSTFLPRKGIPKSERLVSSASHNRLPIRTHREIKHPMRVSS